MGFAIIAYATRRIEIRSSTPVWCPGVVVLFRSQVAGGLLERSVGRSPARLRRRTRATDKVLHGAGVAAGGVDENATPFC